MINKNNLYQIGILFLAFALLIIPSISAELGCCFDSSSGLCSMNSESSTCTDGGGEYSSSASCSIDECQKACCVLGSSTAYLTARECELFSDSYGFELDFQSMDEESCTLLSQSADEGACLSGDYSPYDCVFTTFGECASGNFYSGFTCTDSSLSTSCTKTEETTCENDDVYTLDSCGNRDTLKYDCDYASGTTCDEENGVCKSLNCVDSLGTARTNGERWCSLDSTIYNDYTELFGDASQINVGVGSRFFGQYCLDGEISTESCGDFREEYCTQGSCESNNYIDCFDANLEEVDTETDSKVDEDKCDPNYCHIFEVNDCVRVTDGSTSSDATSKKAGGTQSTGTVLGDFCGSARNDYTSVDTGATAAEEYESEMTKDLHLEMCVPDIAGGVQFYAESDSSSSSDEEDSSICSVGSLETELVFKKRGDCIYFDSGEEGEYESYGNLAILSSDATIWKFDDVRYLMGTEENPYLFCGSTEDLQNWVTFMQDAETTGCLTALSSGIGATDIIAGAGTITACSTPLVTIALLSSLFDGFEDMIVHVTNELPDWIANAFVDNDKFNVGLVNEIYEKRLDSLPVNTQIITVLNDRCQKIGDCDGKVNWVGASGQSGEVSGEIYCSKSGSEIKCPFTFECAPYEAPSGSDSCSMCGADGLECSEYRCMALGAGCEFVEPEESDKGYCISSSDYAAPTISLTNMNPTSPIAPYTPVEITIATSEDAKCKFNIDSSGESYSEMDYDFGSGYTTEHTISLTLPGQVYGIEDDEANSYELINTDGEYNLYVRCVDVAGNGETSGSFLINFEVMQTPDGNAPTLSDFSPVSGNVVKFNTTEKTISFQISEPAECKWSESEQEYSSMINSFSCDTSLSDSGTLYGYWCSGTVNNITLDLESETKYYIKCKDQPWLEGLETDVYKRNVHTAQDGYSYILRPSEELKIGTITPKGTITKSISNTTFDIETTTSGGGANGVAVCRWKLSTANNFSSITSTEFFSTNSTYHIQPITTNLNESQYYTYVKCEDSYGNTAESNGTFYLDVDDSAPILTRFYNSGGLLNLETNENAYCVFSLDDALGCLFDYKNNGTAMSGFEKDHTTSWIYDKKYYVNCKDDIGNYNDGCIADIRTY